jgi:hypothetical protein
VVKLETQSFKRNESSLKYARSGNSTTRSLIALASIVVFLLYVTSIGVSASTRDTGSSVAGTVSGGQIATTNTKTVTKTVHDTTTLVFVKTSTVTKTSTLTSTTTSAVCCQTVTSTVSEAGPTTTVTTTTTATPEVSSGHGNITCNANDSFCPFNIFQSDGPDCSVVLSLETSFVSIADSIVDIRVTSFSNVVFSQAVADGSDVDYTNTFSGGLIQLFVDQSSTGAAPTIVAYSYTAICPPS